MTLNNNKKYHSWEDIYKNNNICYIEDPILTFETPKEIFYDSYKEILNTFTNQYFHEQHLLDVTKTMDYYFEKNPLRPNTLMFKDEKKKTEFYNIGLEMNSVVDLTNIWEGTYKSKPTKVRFNLK